MIVTSKLASSVVEFAKASEEIVKIQTVNQAFLAAATLAGRNVVPLTAAKNFANPLVPIADHFTCIKPLSRGFFGKVGLWTDQAGHRFAIKEMVKPSVNEFNIGLALDHPNIVKIHNYVTKVEEVGVRHYLIMEYIDGCTTQKFVQESRQWLKHPVEMMQQALNALGHMFDREILPGDLHCSNVMVAADGSWKFVDLADYSRVAPGLARQKGLAIINSFVKNLLAFCPLTPATS